MGSGIAFEIGPIVVHWYGLLVVVGALLGGYVATREARRRAEDPEHVWNALIWCLFLGLLGARLYHVFSSPATGTAGFRAYVEDPIAVFRVWDGGLGIYGAVAGGVIGLLIYARRHRLSAWRWLDIGAPGLVLAQALGRWANLINQELYGPPTRLPWGLYIGADHRLPRYADLTLYPTDTTRFHPTFLYESLWNLGLFLLLMWGGRRWAHRLRDGDLFLAYLVLYALGRLWIEQFFRPDAWTVGDGLPIATLLSLALALLAALTILLRHLRPSA
ncbi:MAG: prolipoprotein diacylglyceryl transferase [Anaerolineae bacterium]|nr:MAG: prolipoprotein diacylglyceryl transferase [Anaerolineae bacterium]